MSTFFAPSLQNNQTFYQLSEEESKHCIRVLRMQVGAVLELVNGRGLQAQALLQDAHPKRCMLEITSIVQHAPTPNVHIAMAPTKNMDPNHQLVLLHPMVLFLDIVLGYILGKVLVLHHQL